jgi:hypothetical protein
MSARTEAIAELVDQHNSVLEAWSMHRCQEERDLVLHKVKAAARGYILWFATLSEALLELLAQRSWTSIRAFIDESLADGIAQARQTPADSSGVPSLLSTVFRLNILLETINTAVGKSSTGKAGKLFQADLVNALQTALPLLGTDKAQAIYDDVRQTFDMLPFIVIVDLSNGSLDPTVDQPTVPSLDLFTGFSLAGKTLRRTVDQRRSQLVSNYSGGSALSQVTQTLALQIDGCFTLQEKTFSAIVGAGLASEQTRSISGKWQIALQDVAPHLRLQTEGQLFVCWKSEVGPGGSHCLDGQRWQMSNR